MHDLGFYPSIQIDADNNTGNINLELLNNDSINIPFNMIKVDDENLTTGDFEDSPILVVDIDELENISDDSEIQFNPKHMFVNLAILS